VEYFMRESEVVHISILVLKHLRLIAILRFLLA
jgi:hypothetical protein